jgi:hypothetical protein
MNIKSNGKSQFKSSASNGSVLFFI